MSSREQFKQMAEELTENLQRDTVNLMLKVYDALTADEHVKFQSETKPYYLPRAIGMVIGDKAVHNCFAAEAIKGFVPRINRILNRRVW